MDSVFGQRLRQVRVARGLTLDALAATMGGIVTKQAIGKYEQGQSQPSPLVLNRLASALDIKAATLWREPAVRIEILAYRKRASLPVREREAIESAVSLALEERVALEAILGQGNGQATPVHAFPAATPEDAEDAAEALRRSWDLGMDPIASVVDVLEDRHCHVIELVAPDGFDGISAVARDEDGHVIAGAVVSRQGVPGDRQRLNVCHELGHLVLRAPDSADAEKLAFRFGAAFLAPAATLRREIGVKRVWLDLGELLLAKRTFGMSLQALLYRLKDLAIISDAHYQQWCIRISEQGWRKEEPAPLSPERPQWLERNVRRAVAEGLLTADDGRRLLGEQLAERPSLSLVERRAFLGLPLEERRRLLAVQAEQVATAAPSTEWEDLETGDFLDE
ncbi:MAG: XRE family transcriptional regulator [Chloroflexi bacterium]|nr:XRE family transcriptional regulator [Chloroflexota bacterium]